MTGVYILHKTFCIGGNIFVVKVDKFLATKYENYSTTSAFAHRCNQIS